jgi:predicted nuclease of restriction endonuclease-like (RecB) superfamily
VLHDTDNLMNNTVKNLYKAKNKAKCRKVKRQSKQDILNYERNLVGNEKFELHKK